ncbi:MAG: hypothetical protein K2M34_01335 [Alphaproteobacteria bacterium]|nr:hypothetical protein [Alphaproteobacteria bacterium]
MKKYTWLFVFAMLGLGASGLPATAAIVTESEFENSIGDKDNHNDGTRCYWDRSSCNYSDSYGKTLISWNYNGNPTDDLHCDGYIYRCIYNTSNQNLANGWVGIASCTSCQPGYELTGGAYVSSTVCASPQEYWNNSGPDYDVGSGTGSIKANLCNKNCNSTTCASTAWTAKGEGYETRIYRTCSATGTSGTCNSTTQYRCAAGYWGSSTNGTSGCSRCPEWTSPIKTYTTSAKTTYVRGTSDTGNTTAITGCYVVAGTYYDATGTLKTTDKCKYTN